VIAFVHAFDALHGIARDVQRDEARAVGGQRHVDDVEKDAVHGDFVVTRDLGWRLQADFWLRLVRPGFVQGETLLEVAHAGEPRVKLVAVARAEFSLKRLRLRPDDVHHAASRCG
jgi:hypothetical protein